VYNSKCDPRFKQNLEVTLWSGRNQYSP